MYVVYIRTFICFFAGCFVLAWWHWLLMENVALLIRVYSVLDVDILSDGVAVLLLWGS